VAALQIGAIRAAASAGVEAVVKPRSRWEVASLDRGRRCEGVPRPAAADMVANSVWAVLQHARQGRLDLQPSSMSCAGSRRHHAV